MRTRARFTVSSGLTSTVLAAALLGSAPARADVTVYYAPPAPSAPLVARPVRASERTVTAPRASDRPRTESPVATTPPSPPSRPPEPRSETTERPSLADRLAQRVEAQRVEAQPVGAQSVGAQPVGAQPVGAQPVEAPRSRAEAPPEPSAVASSRSSSEACVAPAPVRFVRATDGSRDVELLPLVDCHGQPDPESLERLSILARPRTADAPTARDRAAHVEDPEMFASEVRRLDPGLLVRLRRLADHFPGHDIEITSGYRPDARETSRHRTGHAMDIRLVGVPIEEVHAFALTFDESGVGLYPTSEFIHLDVRPRVTRWVDLAGPGEPAQMAEVVTGRDGHAASAPSLRWPQQAERPATPASTEATRPTPLRGTSDDDARDALRDAMQVIEQLESLELERLGDDD